MWEEVTTYLERIGRPVRVQLLVLSDYQSADVGIRLLCTLQDTQPQQIAELFGASTGASDMLRMLSAVREESWSGHSCTFRKLPHSHRSGWIWSAELTGGILWCSGHAHSRLRSHRPLPRVFGAYCLAGHSATPFPFSIWCEHRWPGCPAHHTSFSCSQFCALSNARESPCSS